jgi:hypothetical protein
MSSPVAGRWPNPPKYTDHAIVKMRRKGVPRESADMVCMTCPEGSYDEENDSYELSGWVAGGHLEVCVTAESYLGGDQLVVKTAYWLEKRSPAG